MEKRGCKRKIKRLPVTFSNSTSEYNGFSSDYSCKGIFIRTKKGFAAGTTLHMTVEINSGLKLRLTGVVRWTVKTHTDIQKNGMGIELTSIPSEYVDFIERLYRD